MAGSTAASEDTTESEECGGTVVYNCEHTHTDDDGNEETRPCIVYNEGNGDHIDASGGQGDVATWCNHELDI